MRCFVDVARVVSIQTVAEYVDRPDVLARLREMGVDFAQGFLLHRPALIDELAGTRFGGGGGGGSKCGRGWETDADAEGVATPVAASA